MTARWSVKFNAAPVTAMLDDIQKRQLPFAHSLALTNTALFARKQVIDEMKRVFDRPRPQTVNEKSGPLRVKTADRRKYPNDYSEVRVKDFARTNSDPALVYLSPHIHGNARIEKRSEHLLRRAGVLPAGWFAIPGPGADLDQYGNMKRGQVSQVLAAIGRGGKTRAMSKKAAAAVNSYFVSDGKRIAAGIWQRKSGRTLAPIMLFIQGAPKYSKRIRWDELAMQAGRLRFPVELREAMRYAIATAKVAPNPLAR